MIRSANSVLRIILFIIATQYGKSFLSCLYNPSAAYEKPPLDSESRGGYDF